MRQKVLPRLIERVNDTEGSPPAIQPSASTFPVQILNQLAGESKVLFRLPAGPGNSGHTVLHGLHRQIYRRQMILSFHNSCPQDNFRLIIGFFTVALLQKRLFYSRIN